MRKQEQAADDFFEKCRREQPDKYAEICEKYPTISSRRWRQIHEREESRGLLGLQPSYISPETAETFGLESVYEENE